jgi:hypothetical protein
MSQNMRGGGRRRPGWGDLPKKRRMNGKAGRNEKYNTKYTEDTTVQWSAVWVMF